MSTKTKAKVTTPMAKPTVKERLDLKGLRQIAFAQVAGAEEAMAPSQANMDRIGSGFRPDTHHFPLLVP